MSRKMKNLSAKILLDFLAFFAMSTVYLVGRALAALFSRRGGML